MILLTAQTFGREMWDKFRIKKQGQYRRMQDIM